MNSKYLVINAGSSSLKFSLFEMPDERELVNGYVEKIGLDDSFWSIKTSRDKITDKCNISNHTDAVKVMLDILVNYNFVKEISEIKGIGHRVLHGGEKYANSVVITDQVLEDIIELTKLGPLHHPGEIAGIKAMRDILPNVYQVAVFDTAFHQTMPKENYLYATPYEWYEKIGVRKYGFHGTSHKYLTSVMQDKLGKKDVNLIICHVGSGASISCIKDGKCFDTTMGLTPLDGLIMGTRCGNIDSSIIKYVMEETGYSILEIDEILNKKSGLLGICGKSDFRDVWSLKNEFDPQATLAYQMYKKSIIKYIAQYFFELQGEVDAIIFTAGVLENNAKLREDIVDDISPVIKSYINREVNDNIGYGHDYREGLITNSESNIGIYVIPTNEEIMILRDTYNILIGKNK